MNSLSGTLFIQKVRNAKRTRRIPFLIYSKRLSVQDLRLTSELGMTNVLGMPFDRIKATSLIREILEAENSLTKEEVRLRKMEDLLEEGKPAECLKFIGPEMTKKGPHLSKFNALVAEAWLQLGKTEKSMKLLEEAIQIDSENLHAKFLLSRVRSHMGQHDEAIRILHEMIDASPLNISTKVKLGSAFVDADRHDEAKKVFSEVMDLDPDSIPAKEELGKIAFKEGDLPLAGQLLAQTENGDILARYFNSLGIALVAIKNFDKGIETYMNAISILANKAKTHLLLYNLGLAYRKKGDLKLALSKFAESYVSDPSFEKAYAGVVTINREMREKQLPVDSMLIARVKATRERSFALKRSGQTKLTNPAA